MNALQFKPNQRLLETLFCSARTRVSNNPKLFVFSCVFLVCILYAAFTNHAWEDYYITYRSSKNLATGEGLVFTIGQRIHSFTSPLNVLLPAAFSLLTGNQSDQTALWLFRIVSSIGVAGAGVYLYLTARTQGFSTFGFVFLIVLFTTNAKIIDFSINGQEIGLMVFFMALMLHSLSAPSKRPWIGLAISWTGLLWTRPDSPLYIAFLSVAFVLFNNHANTSRVFLIKNLLIAGVIAAILYLPWLIWAWMYFGSPIPHTIIAKSLENSSGLMALSQRTLSFVFDAIGIGAPLQHAFAPAYTVLGGWPDAVVKHCQLVGWLAAWYWVLPFGSRPARAASFAFLLSNWYLCAVAPIPFPWYFPTSTILAIYVLSQIANNSLAALNSIIARNPESNVWRRIRELYIPVALSPLVFSCLIFGAVAIQMRVQQREIEEGTRKKIGMWLRDNSKNRDETVFLEPLGYIGYYSQLKMLDWPGLCSPEVVAMRKQMPGASQTRIMAALKPTWLVLRPIDVEKSMAELPDLLKNDYRLVNVFDATERIIPYAKMPGFGYLAFDRQFYVFLRN